MTCLRACSLTLQGFLCCPVFDDQDTMLVILATVLSRAVSGATVVPIAA